MQSEMRFDILDAVELQLVEGDIKQSEPINAAWLQREFRITAAEAEKVLGCCFRKGLLDKTDDKNYRAKAVVKPNIFSVHQFAQSTGLKPRSIVRSVRLVAADEAMADKLMVPTGAPIYQQKRSRMIDDLVVANQCNSIPQCVTPGLEQLDLKDQSFQNVLENKYHAVVYSIEEDYTLPPASQEDRAVLGLQNDSRVICISRLSLSATDMPLVYAEIHLNPEHYHLVENLWPQARDLMNAESKKDGE